jgi:hypothetical protein
VLREREHHIAKLESELEQKSQWLDQAKSEHSTLVDLYREQSAKMKAVQAWGLEMDEKVKAAEDQIQSAVDRHKAEVGVIAAGYNAKIAELEAEVAHITEIAKTSLEPLQAQLAETHAELARCVDILHETEKTVEERTLWAQTLQSRVEYLEAAISALQGSRWIKLGRKIGVGPDLSRY